MNRNFFAMTSSSDLQLPLYITSAGEWDHQEPIKRPKGFSDAQWIQCMDGEGELTLGDSVIPVRAGQGMWLQADEPHAYQASEAGSPWRVRWISFNGSLLEALLETLKLRRSAVLYHAQPETTLQRMNQAMHLLEHNRLQQAGEGSAQVYHLLMDLHQGASYHESKRRKLLEQLVPVFAYVEERYKEPITLAELAKPLEVSGQHLCLLFKQALNMRPFEYLTRYRLRMAKELMLEKPTLPVKKVAKSVGYDSVSYFIHRFKQLETITPKQFQQVYGHGQENGQ